MRIKRNTIRLAALAAALLAAASLGAPAKAQSHVPQSSFHGKFTLPYEVRWGNAVLPAGDYVLGFTQDQTPANISIQDAKTLRNVAYELTGIRQDGKGESVLVVSVRGSQHVVCSLTIAELGETFVYQRPSARRHETEEVGQTQTVPILLAQK
jgi:hypothetical protein